MHLVASSRELLLSSSFVRMMPAPIILFSVHGAASGQVFSCGEVSKVATLSQIVTILLWSAYLYLRGGAKLASEARMSQEAGFLLPLGEKFALLSTNVI